MFWEDEQKQMVQIEYSAKRSIAQFRGGDYRSMGLCTDYGFLRKFYLAENWRIRKKRRSNVPGWGDSVCNGMKQDRLSKSQVQKTSSVWCMSLRRKRSSRWGSGGRQGPGHSETSTYIKELAFLPKINMAATKCLSARKWHALSTSWKRLL